MEVGILIDGQSPLMLAFEYFEEIEGFALIVLNVL